jgi:uncharacterized protein
MDASPEPLQNRPGVMETELVAIKSSLIHGLGGFARTDLPRGTRVIEYMGDRINKQESLRRCELNNEYIFTLNEQVDLDGNIPENPARFINHSCEPNCDAEVVEDRIWIIARRDIRAGEEITFNYGFDLDDYRDYPCCCGSAQCVGFMVAEDFFSHIRNQQELSFS